MIQFVTASSLANLKTAITAGTISEECIAFIISENLIYANGDTYECNYDASSIEALLAKCITSASYDSDAKTINYYASDGVTVLSSIDATAFIKDGMIKSAKYTTTNADGDTGAFIHIAFNTDAGLEDIYVDLSDLIDTDTTNSSLTLSGSTLTLTDSAGKSVSASLLSLLTSVLVITTGNGNLEVTQNSSTFTISETVTGVVAGSYGPSADASPEHGSTFQVPYVTVNEYGKVTEAGNRTVTLPSDSDTTNSSMSYEDGTLTLTDSNNNTVKADISGILSWTTI